MGGSVSGFSFDRMKEAGIWTLPAFHLKIF